MASLGKKGERGRGQGDLPVSAFFPKLLQLKIFQKPRCHQKGFDRLNIKMLNHSFSGG